MSVSAVMLLKTLGTSIHANDGVYYNLNLYCPLPYNVENHKLRSYTFNPSVTLNCVYKKKHLC